MALNWLSIGKSYNMMQKLFFNYLSITTQISYLKKKGIVLGTRIKDERKIYIYMLPDVFVEVMYKNDNVEEAPEALSTVKGFRNLNTYLEKQFKTTYH